jgi:hypothetical protein
MKLPTVQLPPFSRYFITLRSKYSLPLKVGDQVSHPYETTGRIIVLYILIFKFVNSRREDKRL